VSNATGLTINYDSRFSSHSLANILSRLLFRLRRYPGKAVHV
jgi:hypothetical protein